MPWTPCNPRLEKGLGRGGLLERRVHPEPRKSEYLGWAPRPAAAHPFLQPLSLTPPGLTGIPSPS